MIIEQIELFHYRNYEHLILTPHEGINIFFGKNGSGKTNLLEAVHFCALGKSHRVSHDIHAVMSGQQEASCAVKVRDRMTQNEIMIRLQAGESSVKSIWINQKKAKKLSEMMGVLQCVIFSPEDLDLIKEGPSVRRRFLDMMISQISRPYFVALQQYRLAMDHRNAILRTARIEGTRPDAMIRDFEISMANQAKVIYEQRKKYTDMLEVQGNRIYRQISGKEEESFHIQYHSFCKNDQEADSFQEVLEKTREEDLRQGVTGQGPHRDDLNLSLNRKSMKLFASQGQMRTAALSLKLAQLRILAEISGENPVLLLDDVMSELDLQRRMNLLQEIGSTQTFITCSDEGDLEECQTNRTYFVYQEENLAQIQETKEGPLMEKPQFSEPDFSF